MNRTAISDLGRALRVLGEHGERLSPTEVPPEHLHEIGTDLTRARRLLDTTCEPAPATSCRDHPHGPVEPDSGGQCLICRNRRAAAQPGPYMPDHFRALRTRMRQAAPATESEAS